MSVKLAVELTHPEMGKGRVEIECTAIPNDLFIPMALSKLGKNDDRMADLLQQILSSYEDEDMFDESEDGSE